MPRASKKKVEKQEEVVQDQLTQESQQSPGDPPQLNVTDLQVISRAIDLASRRGAFHAAEMSQVGDAFNKLVGFLTYIESQSSKEEQPTEQQDAA